MTLVVILTVRCNALESFRAFETAAANIMARHGGAIERVVVVPAQPGEDVMREVHVVTFSSADAFSAYQNDEALRAVQHLREASVVRTEVLTGEDGPGYGAATRAMSGAPRPTPSATPQRAVAWGLVAALALGTLFVFVQMYRSRAAPQPASATPSTEPAGSGGRCAVGENPPPAPQEAPAETAAPPGPPAASPAPLQSQPTASPQSAPPAAASDTASASSSSASSSSEGAVSIAQGIEGVRTLGARMDALEARVRDAGATPEAAAAMREAVQSQEAEARRSQLEGGEPGWPTRLDEFRAERDAIARDSTLDAAARAGALESLRRRRFPGADADRLTAAEQLEDLARTTPRDP